MSRVLITRQLPPGSLDPLLGHELVGPQDDTPFTPEELKRAVADVEGIVCLLTDRIDSSVLQSGPNLRVVANAAVGYDNIDLKAAAARHITVCNTPGVLDETTADLTFALILASSRLMTEAQADLREGRWAGWGISQYLGRDVHGACLGVVGYGRIGRAVARRGAGFGMQVLHHARHPTGAPGYVEDLDSLLADSDIVSLHVPLNSESHHLIDARRLELMKPSAVLVNTARGAVVDEESLAVALERGQIFAAGLDVYEREPEVLPRLLKAPRTVLLPHIASATLATRRAMGRMAAEGVRAVLAGETPLNLVSI